MKSHLDIIITTTGQVFIHELATERAERLDLGTLQSVAHCRHSRDGHAACSKGMPLCTDIHTICPFAGQI